MRLIGVDVGGTFTDLVCVETRTGALTIHKVPTTPHDPSEAVLNGILELCELAGVARESVDRVLHGTTTATNAILEHDGALTGLITNEGFRDILHIGRHQRPQHYSIRQEVPWQDRPLVKRRHRKVVAGRLAPPEGRVLVPLDEAGVRRAARELRAEGVEAIAICFLFSYLDPAHERRAREIVLEEYPEVFVTTSAEVSPQFREFERFTTTAMNAFIGPKVRRYVSRLEERLAENGLKADLHIMGSNGGVATARMVSALPVMTLLSGPAAGIIGGAWAGALSGRDSLITFDVGGTSADIGIVRDGAFAEASARDTSIAGFPLMVPMIDIHTIGAGGGSIAHVDAGGAFRVGPRSAGAVPGPAAYRRGGTKPTVTDANVVLGRLDAGNFLGGAMSLDVAAAERVIDGLAAELGLSRLETAEGILTLVNANMANLVRSRTVQKGLDPRNFALVAFGGGGPLQAVDVAAMLGIPEVIVPPAPGITSAMGLVATDMKYDLVRTAFLSSLDAEGAAARATATLDAMQAELAARLAADGFAEADTGFERSGDVRYVGQGYELRVAIPAGPLDTAAMDALFEAFTGLHHAEYGRINPGNPIEIVNLRVSAAGRMPVLGRPAVEQGGSLKAALLGHRPCTFRTGAGLETVDTPVYLRGSLPLGERIAGPAIIVQKDTTSLLRPQDSMVADQGGNLLIQVGGKD
ncbi:hydantoinase/oxoprolinase family protein (plasmid) [Paroceanicella profunda]|uniref:Hydantoinase/oxoprolinase family protein n=1 Tax=Paroceanicella profunda TaxID=2579971 RepID=A0A5B8G0G7_9RHOB|nr:hydantoinase/oxoprolinase family protein [Paroceanicella profunda]QDL94606.1 hydantoinase/oxoprolinase family protein [Paroceanicella profunda]